MIHIGKSNLANMATIALLSLGSILLPAVHGDPDLSPLDHAQYQWYVENGVEAETAIELIEKFNNGERIDSLSSVTPVHETRTVENGFNKTRYEYPDGSISLSEIQVPDQVVSTYAVVPTSVGSCYSSSSGPGWVQYFDCLVRESNGVWFTMEFRASYIRASNGTGTITSASSPYIHAPGGNATTPVFQTVVLTGNPAHLTAESQYNFGWPIGSGTARINLYVNGSTAWTTRDGF